MQRSSSSVARPLSFGLGRQPAAAVGRLALPRRCGRVSSPEGRCPAGRLGVARMRPWQPLCSIQVEQRPQSERFSPLVESDQSSDAEVLASNDEWKAIPDIWKSGAEKYGDQLALVDLYHDPPSRFTYKQLEQEILNFSEGLRVIGVSREEKVALFADNSCRWLIADQGVMATGAIDVVRGTKSSDDELLQIYSHSDSVALIVDNPSFFNRLAETLIPRAEKIRFVVLLWGDKSNLKDLSLNVPIFTYDEVIALGRNSRDALRNSGNRGHRVPIKPDDVATLIYTSGTSSSPKGVMLTHRNLLHQMRSLWDFIPAEPGDRFLSMLPSWHVFERTAEYFMFTRGVEQVYTNVKNYKADLQQHKPDYLFAVPLIYETLYSAIQKQISTGSAAWKFVVCNAIKISTLYMEAKRVYEGKVLTDKKQHAFFLAVIIEWLWARTVAAVLSPLHALASKLLYTRFQSTFGVSKAGVCGGGSLPLHVDRFFEAIGVTLKNGYGLTETSSIAFRLPDCNVLGTVGHPIDQTEIKIVDSETGRALPDGSKGVINIRGPQVMKGYYKDPSKTKEAVDEDGWFNTGDLGWVAPNNPAGRSRRCSGMLVVEGRAKHTIVLSTGENVEPSELEEAAIRSSMIKQILVIGQDQRRIGALIVPNKEELALAGGRSSNARSAEMSTDQLMRLIRKEVATWTSGCSFQIGPILLLDEPFTTENGLMTPTMKVKREQVTARYRNQIAKLYQQETR
ncbi:hypothetical protein Taro_047860 [Colocasia esculenta]|uniref:4-coumarate--CoA ligase n=1 Tax=Colocasia esculenta TaxID=4460 RepID=A0A843X710_COLES|nr:hypothetical protein [Colocasia esculenta]